MKKSLTKAQKDFLDLHTKGSWSFDSQTGLVNVEGNFNCSDKRLESFKGIRFGKVTGNFHCSDNNLTSLEGAPQEVGGNFNCKYNELTSLEGAPQVVGGYFGCWCNNLTSLKGAPRVVGEYFYCKRNPIRVTPGSSIKNFKAGNRIYFSL